MWPKSKSKLGKTFEILCKHVSKNVYNTYMQYLNLILLYKISLFLCTKS